MNKLLTIDFLFLYLATKNYNKKRFLYFLAIKNRNTWIERNIRIES